eukprot:TRINITY_DN13357_c0_g2_i2.p1 TRINITY_DN13357_c0_g2~~TRINITY_DN13357_c0_g2_i2.p1  ORF type:complete len:199 (-),score=7.72 TRINITY_DN13357_c0_g2_i2:44-595(-)
MCIRDSSKEMLSTRCLVLLFFLNFTFVSSSFIQTKIVDAWEGMHDGLIINEEVSSITECLSSLKSVWREAFNNTSGKKMVSLQVVGGVYSCSKGIVSITKGLLSMSIINPSMIFSRIVNAVIINNGKYFSFISSLCTTTNARGGYLLGKLISIILLDIASSEEIVNPIPVSYTHLTLPTIYSV